MAAAMCQALPSFYSDYNSKSLFISVSNDFYEKYIVTQDYCVSTHDCFCSLGNCKFHIILIGNSLSQILQRLDKYLYIYQEIDCLYTLYKHRFFSSIVTSSGEVFNQLSCGVQQNLRWKGAEKTPSVSRKRLVRKKFKKRYLSSNQKLASTQTLGSAFLDRIRKVQNSKYEHDLLKTIDYFIDGYGFIKLIMSIFQQKTSDIPSIFSRMFTKLPLVTETKITVVKNIYTKIFKHVRKM